MKLQKAGFGVCLSDVDHPIAQKAILEAEKKAKKAGIVFLKKEFLGFHDGKFYGTYKYPEAVMCQDKKNVRCRTNELLIDPFGDIHKCTRDIYIDSDSRGHLLDPDFKIEYKYRYCRNYGYCNPCDIKVKTDRFLRKGHTAVDVKFIE